MVSTINPIYWRQRKTWILQSLHFWSNVFWKIWPQEMTHKSAPTGGIQCSSFTLLDFLTGLSMALASPSDTQQATPPHDRNLLRQLHTLQRLHVLHPVRPQWSAHGVALHLTKHASIRNPQKYPTIVFLINCRWLQTLLFPKGDANLTVRWVRLKSAWTLPDAILA